MNEACTPLGQDAAPDSAWQVTYVGSATVLFEGCGLRLMTDPVLDPAGRHWPLSRHIDHAAYRYGSSLNPGLHGETLDPVDIVLLSHDQHRDNFDPAGLALARQAKCVLTTVAGARRLRAQGLSHAIGLAPGERFRYPDEHGPLNVIATPARHGRFGTNWLAGDVIGFVVEHPALGRSYITGDTLWFNALRTIKRHGPIDYLFAHLGAARFGQTALRRWLRWSMAADEAVQLCRELEPRVVLPIHFEGWSHYTEGQTEITARFADAGLATRIFWLPRGMPVALRDIDP